MEEVIVSFDPVLQTISIGDPSPTVATQWVSAALDAAAAARLGPTVSARAYGILGTAIFDAWAAYDPVAIATQLGDNLQRPLADNTEANKNEAISYAAYRVLLNLFPNQQAIFDQLMAKLGFDPANTSTNTITPAGIGNVSAQELIKFRQQDGSNQLGNDPNGTPGVSYSDTTGYVPVNGPDQVVDIDSWQAIGRPLDAPPGERIGVQKFLTPHWGKVTPFGLKSGDQFRPDGPERFLLVDGTENLQNQTITLTDGTVLPISRALIGTVINPEFITEMEELIQISANLTDEQKLIAEFWEDGGGTPFPPGTSLTFGQYVSARDNNTIDEDVELFFSLGNAVFDAGVATWEAKRFYNNARPNTVVRELGRLGLIGEPGVDELTGEQGFVIKAFAGPGLGTRTILAENFITYQTFNNQGRVIDAAPPFAEYTSGHSAFSAAGAEILQRFTGSDFFGIGVTFAPGSSRFEPGITPAVATPLFWETFSEAADEAGLSRQFGGIHVRSGDLEGRALGRIVADAAWKQAQFFINGGGIVPLIDGTPGNDNLFGTIANEVIRGLAGNDNLFGNGGEDRILGGTGNDALYGNSGNDELDGGDDDDLLFGNGGNDQLIGGLGNDKVYGGAGNDLINGGAGNDEIYGNGGNDVIFGGDGNDIIYTGSGNDTINAGAGNDTIWLNGGKDLVTLHPGDGQDTINGFQLGQTLLGLSGGLQFSDLTFNQGNGLTQILAGQEVLATVRWVQATQLNHASNFTVV